MRTILITGAAGFLGSHLTDLMLTRGWAVVAVDNLSHGNLLNLELASSSNRFQFHEADIRDLRALRDCVHHIDAVAHLAAFKIPRYGNAKDTLLVNAEGTHNVLNIACEHQARFVMTSTSDVYGKSPAIPFSEDGDSVLGPSTVRRWAYAASKLFDEHLALAMCEEAGIYSTILRIFGSYGPRQNLSWWGGPQSVFIDAILRDAPVPIHGDGQQTRSFTFVRDTVRGIAAAIEADTANQQVVNIGNNQEVTIVELAECIHKMCGRKGSPRLEFTPYDEIADRKYEDVRRRVPDVRKAIELLGFEAGTPLEEGLRETISWQRGCTLVAAD